MSSGKWFSDTDNLLLRQLWKRGASNKELIEAFPYRSLQSLLSRACEMRLGRRPKAKDGTKYGATTCAILRPDDLGIATTNQDPTYAVPLDDPLLTRLRTNHTLAEATREFL